MLIEGSSVADAKMRIFNSDGTEGKMAGNCIRCVGKLLHDKGYVKGNDLTIETASGIRKLHLYTVNGLVGAVTVNMGKVDFKAKSLPASVDIESMIDYPICIGKKEYSVTCLSVGNPHCVVFSDNVDDIDMESIGPLFENAPIFPERINTEFVKVVNSRLLKMRVYERGNGETPACGTGASAAVAAAVRKGICKEGEDVTVKVPGGDLKVCCTDGEVYLTGNAELIFEGVTQY